MHKENCNISTQTQNTIRYGGALNHKYHSERGYMGTELPPIVLMHNLLQHLMYP
jgi:hypothetical protein